MSLVSTHTHSSCFDTLAAERSSEAAFGGVVSPWTSHGGNVPVATQVPQKRSDVVAPLTQFPPGLCIPAAPEPASSYQPPHLSASAGGAPAFKAIPITRPPEFREINSSLPVSITATAAGAGAASPMRFTAQQPEERPMLLRPFRPSTLSPWHSLADGTSSEDCAHPSRTPSLPAVWTSAAAAARAATAAAATTTATSPWRGTGAGAAGYAGASLNSPLLPTGGAHTRAPLTRYQDTTATATVPLPEPTAAAAPATAAAAAVDESADVAVLAQRDVDYAIALLNGANVVLDPQEDSRNDALGDDDDGDEEDEGRVTRVATASAIPLFASPLRRAQIVERLQAQEVAHLTRQRVLEYLDGQVPPVLNSLAASLSLSGCASPYPPPPPAAVTHPRMQTAEGPAMAAAATAAATTTLLVPAHGTGSPTSLPQQPSFPNELGSLPHASGSASPMAPMRAPQTGGSVPYPLAVRPPEPSVHAARRLRCPLCNDLVSFCPHGGGGALAPNVPEHPLQSPLSPLLHAHKELCQGSRAQAQTLSRATGMTGARTTQCGTGALLTGAAPAMPVVKKMKGGDGSVLVQEGPAACAQTTKRNTRLLVPWSMPNTADDGKIGAKNKNAHV